ncbi:glycerol-3-phosphate dehydrogenase [NAD(+)], cytoplasmic-like isoform X3 [Heptranchias perlo]|uniref:glycerol-3-phosphate dehydrogenase [NAD(+)], cytoplasmic-like isoform X3 n=1 Tax=Heptranchias perlo TaxID=212740 RepID=UPI003559495C
MTPPIKVCIVGSGNWGTVIGKIVGENAAKSNKFDNIVNMWVFEEMVNGRKLTEIINTEHENVRYLPGYKLPTNLVAVPELLDAAKDADILVLVVPHQFIRRTCDELKGHIKPSTIGISLIKGIDEGVDGLKLISDIIREKLGIEVSVLMGANLASEVAAEQFCETTIGSTNLEHGNVLKELMQTQNFRIRVVEEADTVEICGALKSIEQLEKEMLNGQKLQGPQTAVEINRTLKLKNLVDKFPLFTAVYQICYEGKLVAEFIQCLQDHPAHK